MLTANQTKTIELARTIDWTSLISLEVKRLVQCGGIDPDNHLPGVVIRVALENVAIAWCSNKDKDYKNLSHF